MSPKDRRATNRRQFLEGCAAAYAAGMLGWPPALTAQDDGWNAGAVTHLIPAASHGRFLIKTSFREALSSAPRLSVDGTPVDGVRTDLEGRFWRFDAPSLSPSTEYELRIVDAGGAPLCDPWPLATFPAPDAAPDRLRILTYTCAGGYDGPPLDGRTFFLDMAARRRLLARGMSYAPDVVIANGDHIYWDIETALNKPTAQHVRANFWERFGGPLDISVPMLHARNAAIFTAVCDYQIAGLYGTTLRSTPAFFLTDDHDNFENDEFHADLVTLPPDTYGTFATRQTQHMYYPEFLPDRNRPEWLPGADTRALPQGANGAFGTLRYGNLLEAVMYDCRRFVDYKGNQARVLPQWVEDWLVARTGAEETTHFLHVPSLPFAYSSGKLGDWYPDRLDPDLGRLVIYEEKPGWQRGWFAQHQRIIEAIAVQERRAPVILQGDFHASAAGRILRSGELTLPRAVEVVMSGTLGTGDIPFPSSFRAVASTPSQLIGMEEALAPVEKNGFVIIDVTPEAMTFTVFTWRPPQAIEEIDTMEPAFVYEVARGR